jgi:hypothetical protein
MQHQRAAPHAKIPGAAEMALMISPKRCMTIIDRQYVATNRKRLK